MGVCPAGYRNAYLAKRSAKYLARYHGGTLANACCDQLDFCCSYGEGGEETPQRFRLAEGLSFSYLLLIIDNLIVIPVLVNDFDMFSLFLHCFDLF